jgi:hypothetical protein
VRTLVVVFRSATSPLSFGMQSGRLLSQTPVWSFQISERST